MTLWNTATPHVLDDVYNPGELAKRRSATFDEPVAELNQYVQRIREARHADPTVPWFDPEGGGTHAMVLLLAQDPSEVAVKGSGFISPDNNDPTARNTTLACAAADLPPRMRVHWNVYPWWVEKKGVDGFAVETFAAAMHAAVPFIDELVHSLVPHLRAVVLMGRHAQAGWLRYVADGGKATEHLVVLRCPHPSPLVYPKTDKKTGRLNSELTIDAMAEARRAAERSSPTRGV